MVFDQIFVNYHEKFEPIVENSLISSLSNRRKYGRMTTVTFVEIVILQSKRGTYENHFVVKNIAVNLTMN